MKTVTKPKRGVNKVLDVKSIRRGIDTSSAAGAMLVDVDKPLTQQQKLFVEHWAKGDSKGSAALKAGYNDESPGYRLCRQPNVLAAYREEKKKYEAAADMDRKQVMEGLKEGIDMARMQSDPATMITGWKTIGQMCGYFAPVETRLKIDVTGNVTMSRLSALSDAELLELIEQGSQDEHGSNGDADIIDV